MKQILRRVVLAMTMVWGGTQLSRAQAMYELYSCHQPGGNWNFCLLPSPSGPNVTPDQVFSRQCRVRGVSDLKKRILDLPSQSTILWLDRFTGTGQRTGKSGTLSYPPPSIVGELKQAVKSHKMKLELSGDTRAQR